MDQRVASPTNIGITRGTLDEIYLQYMLLVSFFWHPNVKKSCSLRLPSPTTSGNPGLLTDGETYLRYLGST